MTPSTHSFFAASRQGLVVVLLGLFGLGLAIRLYDLTDLPLDFHPTRQLLSALKARGMYYQAAPEVSDWQRQMALQQWKTKAEVEPEVFERLVALTYRFTGEQLWVARAYASLFWVLGGIFLFLLVRDRVSSDSAVMVSAYYLFWPYAVSASRSFQPDPLMVMLILLFWWAVARWADLSAGASPEASRASWFLALLAGLLGGLAIFIKFVAAFFVIGAALGAALGRSRLRDLAHNAQAWAMAALGILPSGLYLVYGVVLHGFLGRQFSGRFIPALLLSPLNYLQWATEANTAAGGVMIMLAAWSLFFARERRARLFLASLWGAYLLFGLVFDYHIATHDYYHLPLIPIVALSLAPLCDWLAARLRELTPHRAARLAALALFFYGVLSTAWDIRNQMKAVDYRPQAAMWAEIGERLGHRSGVVALTQDYGSRLAYWGWQNAEIWPNSADLEYHTARGASLDFDLLFETLAGSKGFFLVSDFNELRRQPQLEQRLAAFAIYAQGDGYVIYDLNHLRSPQKP